MNTVFDNGRTCKLTNVRLGILNPVFRFALSIGAKTLADVGCGVGHASRTLAEMGFDVIGIDARRANISEAHTREGGVQYRVGNVETGNLPRSDVVMSLGLLYHLENPIVAIRNLVKALKDERSILAIESRVVPGAAYARLVDEHSDIDQSLAGFALVPTMSLIVAVLQRCGLFVYRPKAYPEKQRDFAYHKTQNWRHRIVLAASRTRIPPSTGFVAMNLIKVCAASEVWK